MITKDLPLAAEIGVLPDAALAGLCLFLVEACEREQAIDPADASETRALALRLAVTDPPSATAALQLARRTFGAARQRYTS